ncbi:hypothetical protein FGIG_04957 [Fasciola gigantica]|uniref:Ras-associating domain-containing protein n=1 Tax=Fasciola gigantica TaxID=46835 RepID=A0A504YMA3_FASGI|nr:hypothetical protein FGIG_04957 [Fasciola gigantica]
MNHWDVPAQDSYTVVVYGEHFEQGEPFQSFTVGSKETAKELIQQILRRNHLNLKDPNLFYLTFLVDPLDAPTNYEPMAVSRFVRCSGDRCRNVLSKARGNERLTWTFSLAVS